MFTSLGSLFCQFLLSALLQLFWGHNVYTNPLNIYLVRYVFET